MTTPAPITPIPTPVISPRYFKYVLEVTLEFPGAQPTAPSAIQIAKDAQTAIAADATINPEVVYVTAYVPTGSGE
jgi:hypothetical protein